MTDFKILAVIPSLSVGSLPSLHRLSDALNVDNVETVVFANGRSLAAVGNIAGVRMLSADANVGFGIAINLAASSTTDWDWLLLVNDDVELEAARFHQSLRQAMSQIPEEAAAAIYFDDAPEKPIPSMSSIIANLSLLAGVKKRWNDRRARTPLTRGQTYRSFSVVAISCKLWESLDGFDERFPFTFEDSDFVRRGLAIDAVFMAATNSGVRHAHSATSRRHIDRVLPVSAWGAFQYLMKWETGPIRARLACIVALLLRIILVPTVKAPWKLHILGIARSIRALLVGVPPKLPAFDEM